ncbi:ribulose-phosphate 3-epimerase, partial [Candidatus Zixiibacteriota bacterium]
MSVQVAPSLLSADFSRLGEEIALVERAGAGLLHLDVMDAHFVPNLTFGPMIIEAVTRITSLPRDTHLMITHPDTYLDSFIKAGASTISFHLEAFEPSEREERATAILDRLGEAGVGRGIALNPDTPLDWVLPWLDHLDHVLI